MKKIISIAVSLAMVCTILAGCSKEEVYRLIKVKSFDGAVTVEREEKMDVFEGLQLISEDSVEVGEASLLELLADSDKHIIAEENTAFKLRSTGTEASGNITVDLLYGKSLFTIDNKLPEGSEFIVNTPNAILSVRGTSYGVEYCPETEESRVTVFEGQVHAEWEGGEELVGMGGEIAVTGSGDDIAVTVISEGNAHFPSEGILNPDAVAVSPFSLKYINDTAFEVRYSDTKEFSGIRIKGLEGWTAESRSPDDDLPDEFSDNGVRIRYWALTKADVEKEIDETAASGRVNSLNYLKNGDGDSIISMDFKFDNTDGGIQTGYQYYKEISDSLCLSVTVCDEAQGKNLASTDIHTFLKLTENKYCTYSADNQTSGNISPTMNSGPVDEEAWSGLLKGGADYEQLAYLLQVAGRCAYNHKTDYLEDALYWMCCKLYDCPSYGLIEKSEDGSAVYSVSELNTLFSFLTNDTINEENLNPGINRLDGDRLICTTDFVDAKRTPSAAIANAYYNGPNEIIVEYIFNVVYHETFEVDSFEKTAHLIPDETGKFVLGYIE